MWMARPITQIYALFLWMAITSLSLVAQTQAQTPAPTQVKSKATWRNSLCICQVGEEPAREIGVYVAGCRVWFEANNCLASLTQPLSRPIHLPENIRHLKLGYVGHWESSVEMQTFLKDRIEPLLPRLDSLKIDNTACKAMNEPQLISDWIKSITPRFQTEISIIGNQTTSIGMWQPFAPWLRSNFAVQVSTKNPEPQLPQCRNFYHRRCIEEQHGESGRCLDLNSQVRTLTCGFRQVRSPEPQSQLRSPYEAYEGSIGNRVWAFEHELVETP